MKLSDLMPDLYNNNLEMSNIIYTEENELENNIKTDIDNAFIDNFANKATENGISNFEKMLNIKPNLDVEDLEFRRQRVLSRLISSIPYTEKYLINKLNSMLGEGNWDYTIDYNNYTLSINSLIPGKSWYREVLDFLNRTVPCNIQWSLNVYQASWGIVKDHFSRWNDISSMTWQQVLDGGYTT